MAFRDRMHERNIYKIPPDFQKLAEEFPDLKKHLLVNFRGKTRINFKDIDSLRTLTRVLLLKDFNLDVKIPEGFLVPTVPQRLNYILWIEDLLSEFSESYINMTSVQGIDIGTGPSCILALLGARKNGWSYLATECSEESVAYAIENVEKNNLQGKVEVLKVDKDSCLKDILDSRNQVYDFCVCNPPFFESIEEITRKEGFGISIDKKAKSDEIITDGGEISFVKKIIADSLILKEKVRLYTSMLGKKKSYQEIRNMFIDIKNARFTAVEFFQGNTVRWGIAWTFTRTFFRPKIKKKPPKKHHPLSFAVSKKFDQSTVCETVKKLQEIFTEFEIEYRIKNHYKGYAEMILQSNENTWTHQRIKRRELERNKKNNLTSSNEETARLTLETNHSVSLPETNVDDEKSDVTKDFKSTIAEVEDLDASSKIAKKEFDVSEDKQPEVSVTMQELHCSIGKDVEKELNSFIEKKPDIDTITQSVKRSIEEDENSKSTYCKRLKVDFDSASKTGFFSSDNFKEDATSLLYCIVKLKKTDDSITLEMNCPEGANRNSMHQLFLFLKNKL